MELRIARYESRPHLNVSVLDKVHDLGHSILRVGDPLFKKVESVRDELHLREDLVKSSLDFGFKAFKRFADIDRRLLHRRFLFRDWRCYFLLPITA